MTDKTPQHAPAIHKNRLVLFVTASIIIALVLVVISMILYVSSGAIQLDASRPGVKSVSDKIDQTDSFKSFPATGPVDKDTLDQFRELYDGQVQRVTTSDAFSPEVLEDEALGIDAGTADE
jgi:hypothetical protein